MENSKVQSSIPEEQQGSGAQRAGRGEDGLGGMNNEEAEVEKA